MKPLLRPVRFIKAALRVCGPREDASFAVGVELADAAVVWVRELHFLLCGRGELEELGEMSRYVGHDGGGESDLWVNRTFFVVSCSNGRKRGIAVRIL